MPSFLQFSLSFPGSGVTWSETGALCRILLKVGPPGHGGSGIEYAEVEVGGAKVLDICGEFLFPLIPLNLASKLFHSFFLERSPHLEKM